MTPDRFDPAAASAILADLRTTGRQIAELPPEARPRTLAEGYDVQDRLVARLGEGVRGWKVGLGSAKAKRDSGIGRAIAGRVLGNRVHGPGDVVTLLNAAPVTVEFEVALVLARDVVPGEAIDDPLAVVAETRVAFELVLSRFADRRAAGWPSFVADNSGFEALVVGAAVDPRDLIGIAESLVVEADGRVMARAATGDDETVPADALADLIALARDRDMVLPAGAIVSTGTMSVPFAVTGAARIVARYRGGDLSFAIARP